MNDPKDILDRHFSSSHYIHYCANLENQNNSCLVYSKELDKVFCFFCKMFCRSSKTNHLAQEGFNDWSHLTNRLKEHESSGAHVAFMNE